MICLGESEYFRYNNPEENLRENSEEENKTEFSSKFLNPESSVKQSGSTKSDIQSKAKRMCDNSGVERRETQIQS